MLNFYRRFLPKAAAYQAHLTDYLKGSKKNYKRKIDWNETAINAFEKCKSELSNSSRGLLILLVHYNSKATLAVMVDASDTAIGGGD